MTLTVILAVLFLAAAGGCVYGWRRNRKMYRVIDRMLDEILDGEEISQSDIREGELSALASKAKRIREKVENGIFRAEEEKEQVKSLISNMSHQLKTPLAGLMMYREMLEEEGLDDRTRKKFLQKMKQQSEKIDWILQSLFKMVNLEQGAVVFEAEPLPIKETILDAVTAVLDKADKKGIEITTEPFADQTLWHNRKWTAEVLVNLLENAIRHSGDREHIQLHLFRQDDWAVVEVRDRGRGISPEVSRAVQSGRQLTDNLSGDSSRGMGIGLSVCQSIIKAHDGFFAAGNDPEGGAVFRFGLPMEEIKDE